MPSSVLEAGLATAGLALGLVYLLWVWKNRAEWSAAGRSVWPADPGNRRTLGALAGVGLMLVGALLPLPVPMRLIIAATGFAGLVFVNALMRIAFADYIQEWRRHPKDHPGLTTNPEQQRSIAIFMIVSLFAVPLVAITLALWSR